MGIEEGAEDVISIEIVPIVQGRSLPKILARPNQATDLDLPSEILDALKIRLNIMEDSSSQEQFFSETPNQKKPKTELDLPSKNINAYKTSLPSRKNPFRILVEEIALFYPVSLSPSQALEFPTLTWGEVFLMPAEVRPQTDADLTITGEGLNAVFGTKSNRPKSITWTTNVNRKVSWIWGIKVKYQVPWDVQANSPCWLQLHLVGSIHQFEKTFCPEQPVGEMFISAKDLFRNEKMGSNEVLQSIAWEIFSKSSREFDRVPLGISFSMKVVGVDLISLRKDFIQYPIFEWNKQRFYPKLLDNEKNNAFQSKWVGIGQLSSDKNSWENPHGRLLENPYFNTKAVIFESTSPLSSDAWKNLTNTQEKSDSLIYFTPWWFEVVIDFTFFIFISGLIWQGWKRKWFTLLKLTLISRYAHLDTFLKKRIQNLVQLQQFIQRTFRFSERVNIIIGLVILVPGMWAVGRYGVTHVEYTLWTLGIFLLVALWHELRLLAWQRQTLNTRSSDAEAPTISWWFGRKDILPHFLYMVTFIALGWTTWNFGSSPEKTDFIWKLLPLTGLVYLFHPWVPWMGFTKVGFWLVVASSLYLSGLNVYVGSSENYLITFAGVAVILAWRNLARDFRPLIEQVAPEYSKKIFSSPGSHYILAFVLALILSSFFVMIRVEALGEQFAIVAYYALIIATFLEIKSFKKSRQKNMDQPPVKNSQGVLPGA